MKKNVIQHGFGVPWSPPYIFSYRKMAKIHWCTVFFVVFVTWTDIDSSPEAENAIKLEFGIP